MESLNVGNVCDLLVLADAQKASDLHAATLDFIGKKFEMVTRFEVRAVF